MFVILICVLISFCNGCDISNNSVDQQEYFFDVYYINYAWGFNLGGFMIDRDGKIFSYNWLYNRDSVWNVKDYNNISETVLNKKFIFGKKLIGRVDIEIFREKVKSIYLIPLDSYSPKISSGADMGANRFSCYRYNNEKKTYYEVILKQTGDISYYNTSAKAEDLIAWLDLLGSIK